MTKKYFKTHGQSRTRFYTIWMGMKTRCFDTNFKQYSDYGGRGITICDSWLKFENFRDDMYVDYLEHSVDFGEKNTSIDRIDTDNNYCKDNCKWSTEFEQKRNTRRNSWFTFKGKKQCLQDWANEYSMKANTLCNRLYRAGWSIEKALTTPITK